MAREYYYHGTTATAVIGIAENGLIEGGGADSLWHEARNRPWAIYVADTREAAEFWARRRIQMLYEWNIEDAPDVIRFPVEAAVGCEIEPDMPYGHRVEHAFVLSNCRIPPEKIEIWDSGKWRPIQGVIVLPSRRPDLVKREVLVRQHRRQA